jgi:putative flippase GtrA
MWEALKKYLNEDSDRARFARYCVTILLTGTMGLLTAAICFSVLHIWFWFSCLIGLAVSLVVGYKANDRWVFPEELPYEEPYVEPYYSTRVINVEKVKNDKLA